MRTVVGAEEAEQTQRTPASVGQPATAPAQPAGEEAHTPPPAEQTPKPAEAQQPPGFGERGRMRRRARFLRKARELAYRDLGGLVFDLHRFGERNDQLVLAKLASLGQIDKELRDLEEVLRERRPVTVLREVGIAACPRCAAIHGSDDRFCPGCGLAFDTHADRPISTTPVHPHPPAPTAQPSVPDAPPKVERTPPAAPLKVEPAPPVKPTAAPVAAKPASPPASPRRGESGSEPEDEPTQILRPPPPVA